MAALNREVPVIKFCRQRGEGDCGIACLTMLTGLSYEDVLVAAVSYTKDKRLHHHGMWTTQIMNTAAQLGITLHKRKKYDLETAWGILGLYHSQTSEGHVVVLKSGTIFDPGDGTIWFDLEAYFDHTKYMPHVLLSPD